MDQDDPPRTIAASARQVTESLKNSGALTAPNLPTDPVIAIERARLLAGCYRRNDAADPETYLMALSAILAEYPTDIVYRVTDPRSGLPSRSTWLPTVKEVRDACDDLAARQRRFEEAAHRERAQLAARAREAVAAKVKPTLEELQAKYGPNWGLKDGGADTEAQKAARRSMLADANRRSFVAECESAGFSPDSPISPSLAAILRRRAAE